ncbi:hypothetical protein Tco_1572179, partial [Tanacetum coccineum]
INVSRSIPHGHGYNKCTSYFAGGGPSVESEASEESIHKNGEITGNGVMYSGESISSGESESESK